MFEFNPRGNTASALYSNIPVDNGIRATLKLQEAHLDDVDTLGLSLDDIRALLKFVLKNGCFRFGEDVYRQKTGVAIGNWLAPPFAVIFYAQLRSQNLGDITELPSNVVEIH